MTKRTGRPAQKIAKARSLEARAKIRRRYPTLSALLDRLAYGEDENLADIERHLDRAYEEVAQGPSSTFELRAAKPGDDREIGEISDHIKYLCERITILSDLQNSVTTALARFQADLAAAKEELLVAALQREPREEYTENLITQLKAAGMSRAKARHVSAGQIAQIIAILEAGSPRSRRPTGVPPPKLQLPPRPQTCPWADFPTELEHFELIRTDVGRDGTVVNRRVAELDLPPFDHLESFGVPHLYEAFSKEESPARKARIAWQICRYWLHDGKKPSLSTNADEWRRPAWTFLLCVKHGFADQVPELKKAKFPSPWKQGEVVEAKRKHEEQSSAMVPMA